MKNLRVAAMQSYPFLSTQRPAFDGAINLPIETDPFDVDLAQIVHTASFRRLQGKVPTWIERSDQLFSTQLTHCIETAQIGETLAQIFEFPPQVMSAIGLAHELGEPPLGAEGVDALREFALEVSEGRQTFSPRAQTLRCLSTKSHGQNLYLTAAVLDALLVSKQRADGTNVDGGYYPEETEFFRWIIAQTRTEMKRHPLAMLSEVADHIAQACRHFEDALEARYLIKEHLLREIHALLLAEPQLSQWCESCFLAPIAAMSPYDELQEIKGELRMRLMRAFFSQVTAVRNSPAFYVRLMTLDYPVEERGKEPVNLIYQYCPLLRKALHFLQRMVTAQIACDAPLQTVRYARTNLMRDCLDHFAPLIIDGAHPSHPLINSLPLHVRDQLQKDLGADLRLRTFIDYVCSLADREYLQLANCLRGSTATALLR